MYTNFLDLAKQRYSCRNFTSVRISDEEIKQIMLAAQIAPTAKNNQPNKILVLNTDNSIEKLRQCTACSYGCKTAFIVCYNNNETYVRPFDGAKSGEVDCAILTTHMMLEATQLNIGSTWVMHFDPKAVVEQFNLSENIIPVAILVVGYPANDAKPTDRHFSSKSLDEIVSYED